MPEVSHRFCVTIALPHNVSLTHILIAHVFVCRHVHFPTMTSFPKASPIKREYLILLQDLVGRSHKWPRAIQGMVFGQTHLNNPERFTVIVFLYRNGVNPVVIRDFLSECYHFDAAAWRQINHVLTELQRGQRWSQWNVHLKHSKDA